ncbi:hypothetical protein BT96DRAFT_959531 [Gymnopus androsaceus JB14]|uniref:Uncharacterized protein n=1 Tax=Gymnopus androsaceus JB14 TaxID=1447944 RepID=A0A6A4H2L6_9AGAR|nr:hypothetical protein BT96DRAFT_959531 [Gymnopus androsaceus JB14]
MHQRFAEAYPGPAPTVYGEQETTFEAQRAMQESRLEQPWSPFADIEEWELARWMAKSVNQTEADEYLKLNIVKNRMNLSFKSKYMFFKKIDNLPGGPCEVPLEEEHELWMRNPVECIVDLIGNPAFREFMGYSPERVFDAEDGSNQMFDEMWTGEWWWKMQSRLPAGRVVSPVILSSDKTKLTAFHGDKSAWPVYLTIGNISKDIRRQASAHAMVLIGYIPVSKFSCFRLSSRSAASHRFFHHCMTVLLQPLEKAGRDGVRVRHIHPILAAYIADHPEQCLIACCKENRCPKCTVLPNNRGSSTLADLRTEEFRRERGVFEARIRPVFKPFWESLPFTDIFLSITPDILHQLHKGVFKDHLVSWVTTILRKKDIDDRFSCIPDHPGLRHFKIGITFEHKEMQKVLLGILAGAVNSRVVSAAQGLLDFIFYAQYHRHTEETLARMTAALERFHKYQDVFIELGIRDHFNIPKIHSMVHYIDCIRASGSLDGYNTEISERLHIDYAKKAYAASNKRDYHEQMTIWLCRQEAIVRQTAYLDWCSSSLTANTEGSDDEDSGSDSDGEEEDEPEQVDAPRIVDLASSRSVDRAYSLTKTPSRRMVSVRTIEEEFGIHDFIPSLNKFLRSNITHYSPANRHDKFSLHSSIRILIPAAGHVKDSKRVVRVRLRAAQLRLVFELPSHLGAFPHPLVYVHWFRNFPSHPDPQTGMYGLTRSTHNHLPNGQVLAATRLFSGCHVIPQFGRDAVPPEWSSLNVLDKASSFFFNHYLDFYIFERVNRSS